MNGSINAADSDANGLRDDCNIVDVAVMRRAKRKGTAAPSAQPAPGQTDERAPCTAGSFSSRSLDRRPARAQVETDGSLGAATRFDGPDVELPASLGIQRGANIFYSFTRLDVPTDGFVTFTPDGSIGRIDNVISRVTGGYLSSIDGTLASTIGESRFFLLNPNGLMFGPRARLSLPGAFIGTTADRVELSDGSTFGAGTGLPFSAGEPIALRFDRARPAPIKILGGLETARGQLLSLVGGDLEISGAAKGYVSALDGSLNLVSVGSPGIVQGGIASSDALHLREFSRLGSVRIVDDAIVSSTGLSVVTNPNLLGIPLTDLSGVLLLPTDLPAGTAIINGQLAHLYFRLRDPIETGSGPIDIRANNLLIADSEVRSVTPWSDGGDISIELTGRLQITRTPRADNNSGLIARTGVPFNVKSVGLGIEWNGFIAGPGAAGNISVGASDIQITGGGQISTTSSTSGRGGEMDIHASRSILLSGVDAINLHGLVDNPSALFSNAEGSGNAGSIHVRTPELRLEDGGGLIAQTTGNGRGGSIFVDVDALVIRGIGQIDASTSGLSLGPDDPGLTIGQGGDIYVSATRSVTISGRIDDDLNFSRISTISLARSSGDAGRIEVVTPELHVFDGGGITARSEGTGKAGNLRLFVASLVLESGGEISAATSQTGGGGAITAQASGSILVDSSGRLTVQSTGAGNAGNIEMSGSRITLRRDAEVSAQALGAGGGGTIEISADNSLRLSDGARVSARTAGEKPGGSIKLAAKEISIRDGSQVSARSDGHENAGSIALLARDSIELADSSITTAARKRQCQRRRHHPQAPERISLNRSEVSASVGGGTGGNIDIDPHFVVMNGSRIVRRRARARAAASGSRPSSSCSR